VTIPLLLLMMMMMMMMQNGDEYRSLTMFQNRGHLQ